MKARFTSCLLLSAICLAAKTKDASKPKEPTVVLPTFVVVGTRIPAGWLEVAWECQGPFPFSRVKRAWLSKVQADSPAAKAGFKRGDTLLAIRNVQVEMMTGVALEAELKREREFGAKEEFLLQTPGKEKRVIVMAFEKSN